MPANEVIDFPAIKVACSRCALRELCLPQGLDESDIKRLEGLVDRHSPLQRGEHLFREGDRFRSLYAVRSGSFKAYCLGDDGSEKILGFHLPGELLGLAGLGDGRHRASASALETASVCELQFGRLQELADHLPSLNHQLHRVMSRRIARDQEILLLLGDKNAHERLATFLLNLSERFAQRGLSAREFNLSMTRQDIANYLGLTLETVSRTFTQFQKDELLHVDRRLIRIRDKGQLTAAAGPCVGASSRLAR
ncbi:MAG: fumarate/nitrate reduction transcriptional regulator Fnr [Acidiferrobacterales bacterium]